MRVTFDLVQRDFLEAYRRHHEARRAVRWLLVLFAVVLAAGTYLAFTQRVLLGGMSIVAALVLAAVLFAKPRLEAQRALRESGTVGAAVTVEFTESGAVHTVEAMRREWQWRSVRRFVETPNLLLFHHHDGSRTILPKRAFTAEQLAHLHALAHRSGVHPVQHRR